MNQTQNSTDKRPRLPIRPHRHMIRMVWIAALLTGLMASCDEYDNQSITSESTVLDQPVGDASSPGNTAHPTDNGDARKEPTTNGADQNPGKDDAAVAPIDGGIGDENRDAGLIREDATVSDTDSSSPPIDASTDEDECPEDPDKTTPGVCGCGVSDTDEDGDGTLDCNDACPQDDNKTEPGLCGCGNEDPSDANANMIDCIKTHLLHRYRFDGTGSTATDSVGSAHGTIHGANAVLASGSLTLGGDVGSDYSDEGYVELPTSITDGLTNATIEAWITWRGEGDTGSALWQRVFDFGDQNGSEGNSYLFLTPQSDSGVLVGFSTDRTANGDDNVVTSTALPKNIEKHLAVVIDDDASVICLYIDGVWQGSVKMRGKLAQVSAVHCWLGRSNFTVDSEFNGSFHEFRIWDVALNDQQLSASFSAGPDYEL
ncbi:MAG: LamG domain-containing protein [Deltaproteobacteria bacterium]|nr:LamG domain-containing protein [Deltaproteobacteria bacterium]